jgi:hypothetical protein
MASCEKGPNGSLAWAFGGYRAVSYTQIRRSLSPGHISLGARGSSASPCPGFKVTEQTTPEFEEQCPGPGAGVMVGVAIIACESPAMDDVAITW